MVLNGRVAGVVGLGPFFIFWGTYFLRQYAYKFEPDGATVVLGGVSSSLYCAAFFSILSALFLAFGRYGDRDMIEIFSPAGCIVFGGAIAVLHFIFPFALFGGVFVVKGGLGLRLLNLGNEYPLFLSILSSMFFFLGGLGTYLAARGALHLMGVRRYM